MINEHPKIRHLKSISVLMDSKFDGPLGLKFGLDGIIGLIPFVGDLIGSAISLYIMIQAGIMGCSPSVLIRMGLNLLIENVIEMIPFVGNFFDFFWKANNKNIELLETHTLNPQGATNKARLVLGLFALSLLGLFIGSIAVTVWLFKLILGWIALFSS